MKPGMPESGSKPSGTVLAFDFGEKRIGVAVGEWQLLQAHPLTTLHGEANAALHGEANAERFTAIAALIEEWQPASLVVGRPLSLDGTAHAMTARCTRFANQLRGRFGLDVEYAEERLSSVEAAETSVEAAERLRDAGTARRNARQHLDAIAAQLILQGHFAGFAEQGIDHLSPRPEHPHDREDDTHH